MRRKRSWRKRHRALHAVARAACGRLLAIWGPACRCSRRKLLAATRPSLGRPPRWAAKYAGTRAPAPRELRGQRPAATGAQAGPSAAAPPQLGTGVVVGPLAPQQRALAHMVEPRAAHAPQERQDSRHGRATARRAPDPNAMARNRPCFPPRQGGRKTPVRHRLQRSVNAKAHTCTPQRLFCTCLPTGSGGNWSCCDTPFLGRDAEVTGSEARPRWSLPSSPYARRIGGRVQASLRTSRFRGMSRGS